jgi:hypothetical protein
VGVCWRIFAQLGNFAKTCNALPQGNLLSAGKREMISFLN